MSRVANSPVEIPKGVETKLSDMKPIQRTKDEGMGVEGRSKTSGKFKIKTGRVKLKI